MTQTFDETVGDDWYINHFDHLAQAFGDHFDETLQQMRRTCPVTHSDRYGGFWVATRYDDVFQVLQDWKTFSSALGVGVPAVPSPVPLLPEELDPPLHRTFRKVLNLYLSPTAVAPFEEPVRQLVNRLIDGFVEDGRCELMEVFAEQLPRVSFFELVMHAPVGDIGYLSEVTRIADGPPDHPRSQESWVEIKTWIMDFVEQRRARPGPDDIVEAVIHADIDGRPITDDEILGTFQVLLFGGFGTTAAALGNAMVRLARDPSLAQKLREHPDLIPGAIEEFLRLDSPVVCLARTASHDTELDGQRIRKGERVLFHLASADRDGGQFDRPDDADLDREVNRHLAFGGGPHRCAGSNLARMNLRVAIEELTARLHDIRLQAGAEPIRYRTVFTRGPVAVPIEFAPGAGPARGPEPKDVGSR